MKSYLTILEEFGWPKIYLVSDRQFRAVEGDGLYRDKKNKPYPRDEIYTGISGTEAPILAMRNNLRGKVLRNNIYHEIVHILYPWRRHWWIECAAEVLAGGGGRGYYSKTYNHTPADLPDRDRLLHLIRLQVIRFNKSKYMRTAQLLKGKR